MELHLGRIQRSILSAKIRAIRVSPSVSPLSSNSIPSVLTKAVGFALFLVSLRLIYALSRGQIKFGGTGTMTDICVLATVVGGMNREYRMTVVEDGTATLWPEIQRATLDIIRRAYGRVLSTRQIADEIGRW